MTISGMFGSRTAFALALAASVAGATSAAAQATQSATPSDPRWGAWIGCWTTGDTAVISLSGVSAPSTYVCFSPAATGQGVDVASIVGGRIVAKERVTADGSRNVKTVDGCPGWETARWSNDGRRIFTRSEFTCPGNVTRKESGIFAMTSEFEWLDVQGVDVMGTTSARATRFTEALVRMDPAGGDSVTIVPVDSPQRYAARTLRLAAAGRLKTENVLDVVSSVDVPVAEAYLMELRQPFELDAATLVKLADSGMPPRVVDLMVALSNPKTFLVGRAGGDVERMARPANPRAGGMGYGMGYGMSGMNAYNDALFACSRYGMGFGNRLGGYGNYYGLNFANNCYGAGYGYGYNNFYYGNQPIIIVTRPDPSAPGTSSSRGRAVAGRGYTRDPMGTMGSGGGFGSGSSSSSGGSSSGSIGGGGASAGSAGGDGGGRTAKPRGS